MPKCIFIPCSLYPTLITNDPTHILELRYLPLEDYADVKTLMNIVDVQVGGAWPLENYQALLSKFP